MKAVQCTSYVPRMHHTTMSFRICSYNWNFQPGMFLKNLEIPAWPFFSATFFGAREYCTWGSEIRTRFRSGNGEDQEFRFRSQVLYWYVVAFFQPYFEVVVLEIALVRSEIRSALDNLASWMKPLAVSKPLVRIKSVSSFIIITCLTCLDPALLRQQSNNCVGVYTLVLPSL